MSAKKATPSEPDAVSDVDMDRIRDLMGPLPTDPAPVEKAPKSPKANTVSTPSSAPAVATATNTAVADAAQEANETLMAMSADMGKSTITKVDDAPITPERTPEVMPVVSSEPPAQPFLPTEGIVADDPLVVGAVNDIVAHEGDEILEAQDEKLASETEVEVKSGFRESLRSLWSHKAFRWALFVVLLATIFTTAIVPQSRYFVLNTAGVRSSLKATVIDSSTLQPLKNVDVSVAGVTAQTDSKGVATLEHIKLGDATLTISKRAFTTITRHITVGWGSNPEGEIRLQASGAQYSFVVTDFLSGKPVPKAEASSGEGNASSDKDGKLVLSLDTSGKADSDILTIQVTRDGYRTETVKITANNKETKSVVMVPAKKDVFVSKRSGKYDIYTIDVDGKNEQKIVSGTGLEREDMALAPQQNGDQAAYVATRENARNSDGYLLSTLYLLDTKTGALTKADQSEQIQIIGWSSDQRLVYAKIAAGASGANPKRHRLMSLNAKNTTDNKELASANSFNDVVMAGDKVLYAPSNAFQDGSKAGLYVVGSNGGTALMVTDKEVYNIFRTDYETVTINATGTYFTYKIGAAASTLAPATTPSSINRLYIDNTATSSPSLWLDKRDGKDLILNYDKTTKKDVTIVNKNGAKPPLYWLNDTTIIFRVNDGKETADYVVSTLGGDARKIQDVTDTSGIGRWYYY